MVYKTLSKILAGLIICLGTSPAFAQLTDVEKVAIPTLPELPPPGPVRALPGDSAKGRNPVLPRKIESDNDMRIVQPAAVEKSGEKPVESHAIYKQIMPDGTTAYGDKPLAGARITSNTRSRDVARDPLAISGEERRRPKINTLKPSEPDVRTPRAPERRIKSGAPSKVKSSSKPTQNAHSKVRSSPVAKVDAGKDVKPSSRSTGTVKLKAASARDKKTDAVKPVKVVKREDAKPSPKPSAKKRTAPSDARVGKHPSVKKKK